MKFDKAYNNAINLATQIEALKRDCPDEAIHLCTGSIAAGAEMLVTIFGPVRTAAMLIGVAQRIAQEGFQDATPVQ